MIDEKTITAREVIAWLNDNTPPSMFLASKFRNTILSSEDNNIRMLADKEFCFRVASIVCGVTRVMMSEVFSKNRARPLVIARQIIYTIIRNCRPSISLERIGQICRNTETDQKRDHATILHNIRMCENNLTIDAEFRRTFTLVLDQCLHELAWDGSYILEKNPPFRAALFA